MQCPTLTTTALIGVLSLPLSLACADEPATPSSASARITLTVTIPEKTYIAAIDKTIYASSDTTVATINISKSLRYKIIQAQ